MYTKLQNQEKKILLNKSFPLVFSWIVQSFPSENLSLELSQNKLIWDWRKANNPSDGFHKTFTPLKPWVTLTLVNLTLAVTTPLCRAACALSMKDRQPMLSPAPLWAPTSGRLQGPELGARSNIVICYYKVDRGRLDTSYFYVVFVLADSAILSIT